MISYIDARSAQIWMLLEPEVKTVQLDVRNYDNTKFLNYEYEVQNPYKFKNYIPVTIPLESLRPNTEFILNVYVDSVKYDKQFDLYTARPHLDDTHFLIGGGLWKLDNESEVIFQSMKKMNSDFMIWMGNNIVSDLNESDMNFRNLVDQYVETRSNPSLNDFLQSTPQIATWGGVDFGKINGGIDWALKDSAFYAFDMFWPNSLRKTYNYTFWDYGVYQKYAYNDLDVFLLDARFFREKKTDNSPSMLGDTQMERLFEEINKSGATFTFIVSPTPFLFEGEESLLNYKDQFDHFMYRLKVSGAEGVILLSYQDLQNTEGNEWVKDKSKKDGLIQKGYISANNTQFKKYEKDPNWSDLRYWHPIYEFNFGQIAGLSQNFSRIKVEGESGKRVCIIETFNETGERLFIKRIHEDELKFKPNISSPK